MSNTINLKTSRGILRRMERILDTPWHTRRRRFGRGWAWELTNGRERIREEFPGSVPEMIQIFVTGGPSVASDLVAVYP